MINFNIRIDVDKLSNYSASLGIRKDKETLLLMIESFSKYILELYSLLIEEAIDSRRYRGKWEPLNEEGYLKYIGVIPTKNILLIIRESLEVKKIGHRFEVRINPSSRYPKSRTPLLRVLQAIEYGTSEFNARPILAKINRQIKNNILALWRGYLTMKGVL